MKTPPNSSGESTDDLRLAGVAHDLNNVLQTFVDAADQLSDDPRWQALSAALLRNVERGQAITATLGRNPETHQEARQASLDQILARAISFVEDARLAHAPKLNGNGNGNGSHHAGGIRFVCDIAPGMVIGTGRQAGAWERVFVNLFLNSVRAMPHGGLIEIRADQADVPGHLAIRVRDGGTGIPAAIEQHLFEPYVSTCASSGLGLHIVRTMVREEGGTVAGANRSDGPGAEFVIIVPVRTGASQEQARTAHAGV